MNNPNLIDTAGMPGNVFSDVTLRDLFAGLAMHALSLDENRTYNTVSEMAYAQADSMLAARGESK